ncbi:MAG: hypothetical protein GY869_20400, partial [Planctomycetes bacterium]|nr:hypothetical protein [Planctomycetota bacterium]
MFKRIMLTVVFVLFCVSVPVLGNDYNGEFRQEYQTWLERQDHADDITIRDDFTLLGEWYWGPTGGVGIISDTHVAIGNGNLFQILDVSDETNVHIIGEIYLGVPSYIEIVGNLAYVCGGGHFQVVDLSDLTNPVLISEIDIPGGTPYMALDPRDLPYVYVIGITNFRIIDVEDPLNPQEVSMLGIGSGARANMALYLRDDGSVYAYVSTMNGDWIYVFDVTNPTQPTAFLAEIYAGKTVAVVDDYLYLGRITHLSVYSLETNPFMPELVNEIDYGSNVGTLNVVGNTMYVGLTPSPSSEIAGLLILDISDREQPQEVHFLWWLGYTEPWPYQPTGGVGTIKFFNNRLHISTGTGIWGVDVSDLDQPQSLYYFPTAHTVFEIAYQDHFAYLATGSGLWILDILDPTQPVQIGHFLAPIWNIVIRDDLAYMQGAYNLIIADISDPTQPVL